MKKAFFSLILLLICVMQGYAQSPQLNNSIQGGMPFAPKMTILDTALIKVYYKLEFKKDSTKNQKTEAQTILLIGNKYTLFTDYYLFVSDSITQMVDKEPKGQITATSELFNLWGQRKYRQWNICDMRNNLVTKREQVEALYYEYEEKMPIIDWKLEEKDTLINGLKCGKATCKYRGRDYVAWYFKDISLPFGPYLFYGLPGLIAIIKDTKDNYVFTLNGLEDNLPYFTPIYFTHQSLFYKDTREKIRATIQKIYDRPVDAMLQDPIMKVDAKTAQKIDRRSDPYNPIELE